MPHRSVGRRVRQEVRFQQCLVRLIGTVLAIAKKLPRREERFDSLCCRLRDGLLFCEVKIDAHGAIVTHVKRDPLAGARFGGRSDWSGQEDQVSSSPEYPR